MFIEQAHTGKNNWFLYILTVLIVFIAIQIASLPLLVYLLVTNPGALQNGGLETMTNTNLGLALTLFTFVAGFFALFLCVRYIHKKNYLDIVTSRPKFDWRRFFFGAGVWTVLSLITILITIYTSENNEIIFQFEPASFIGLAIISLLLLPFQTAFEEIMFRGYLMQGFALFFKSRWTSFIIVSLLFGLMHGANPEVKNFGAEVTMPQYIAMGLILGFIALKDEGLELAIGLHAANNILMALAFTSDSSALQTHALFKDLNPSVSHLDTLILLIAGIIFIAVCNRKYRFLHDGLK